MPERTDSYSGAKYTAPIIFQKLAQTATADAADIIIFRAPQKMVIDKIVAVTSTAYSTGDAADEIDLVVNVGGSPAFRLDSTYAAMSAVGSRASAEPVPLVQVASGALVDVGLDINEAGTISLAAGKLDVYLYTRLDGSE